MIEDYRIILEISPDLSHGLIQLLFAAEKGLIRFTEGTIENKDEKTVTTLIFTKVYDGKNALAKWKAEQT